MSAPGNPSTAGLHLRVAGLHAGYGRAEVLSGVSLEARPGQVVAVVGANGAGKSTLLNTLMGMLPARAGAIDLDGAPHARRPLEDRVAAGVALVPETRALFGALSVADNLRLGGWRLRRAPRTARAARLDAVHALFPRLHERAAQAAGTLSGGERQMLAIGRALMGAPRLLMLDEPSLGLAPRVVREVLAAVDRLRATGVTILLVEQNARAALAVADDACVLETGRVALAGPAAELARDPRVVETYLGRATGGPPAGARMLDGSPAPTDRP